MLEVNLFRQGNVIGMFHRILTCNIFQKKCKAAGYARKKNQLRAFPFGSLLNFRLPTIIRIKPALHLPKWRVKIMLQHKLYGEKAILWDLYQLVTLPTICSLTKPFESHRVHFQFGMQKLWFFSNILKSSTESTHHVLFPNKEIQHTEHIEVASADQTMQLSTLLMLQDHYKHKI